MKFALQGARIFDGFKFHDDSALVIEDGVIVQVTPCEHLDSSISVQNLSGGTIAPGLIDLQVNGGGGLLLNNDPSIETLNTMAAAHAQFGVTRILPTVISDGPEISIKVISAALSCDRINSGILGVHIEGPFFNAEKSGVHRLDKIRKIDDNDWQWIDQLARLPSILTLAPENTQHGIIQKISDKGIRVSAGHTNANYDEIADAVNNGLSGFTHLFNAMRQMHGREPGVVGAALSIENTWAGIIADGIHVHPTSLRTAINAKGFEQVYLVSDSMATIGSDLKHFELYGERIEEKDGRLVNAEGRLAGSAISLLDAVRFCINEINLPADRALAMASRIPATYMKIDDQFGSFLPNRIADVCWLSDDLRIQGVWRAGNKL